MSKYLIYDMFGEVVDTEYTEWEAHMTTNALGYHDHYYVEVNYEDGYMPAM